MWRNGVAYYVRRVPKRYRPFERRDIIWVSLETDSVKVAAQKIPQLDAEYDAYWEALAQHKDGEARQRQSAARAIARAHGLTYMAVEDLAQGPFDALAERLLTLDRERLVERDADVEAVLGGAPEAAKMPVSKALDFFFDFRADETRKKSPAQLRRWSNVRRMVFTEFIALVGDKDITQLERSDFLAYRDALMERITSGDLLPETGNKYLSYLSAVLRCVTEAMGGPIRLVRSCAFARRKSAVAPPIRRPSFRSAYWRRASLMA